MLFHNGAVLTEESDAPESAVVLILLERLDPLYGIKKFPVAQIT